MTGFGADAIQLTHADRLADGAAIECNRGS